MTETIVLEGFPYKSGPDGLNIQQITVENGQAKVIATSPDVETYNQAALYNTYLNGAFVDSSEVDLTDETTGVVYRLSKSDGDGTYSYDYMGPTTITFDVTAVDPPIDGTIYGYSPCFAIDTLIATEIGSVAVEYLRPGDSVTTLAGPATVTWIGHRRARDTDVIRVRAGTLGATRDLIVSDDHALHVGGYLVQAGLLVNGEGIVRERRDEVTFWHVELERHAILLAEGVEAESYLDTGNRRQFGNCPLSYDPVQAKQDPCAEMVLAGTRLNELRASLRSHALA